MSQIELSTLQERAVDAITNWYQNGANQYFYLAGFAGTGKSTLLAYLNKEVFKHLTIANTAYTGKATNNLHKKGIPNTSTLDKLIYRHCLCKDTYTNAKVWLRFPHGINIEEVFDFERYEPPEFGFGGPGDSNLIEEANLIILDECSMVNDEYLKDLLNYGIKVLAVGDPAQLRPVNGTGFFYSKEPDFMLDEIHRQAADSGIIQLATAIRQGKFNGYTGYSDVEILDGVPNFADDQIDWWNTQLIAHRHTVKYNYNSFIRKKIFGNDVGCYPIPGEKLICLRNCKDVNIFNGQQVITDSYDKNKNPHFKHDKVIAYDPDFDEYLNLKSSRLIFQKYEDGKKTEYADLCKDPGCIDKDHVPLDYGYAITCHKAQGSQWEDVYLVESKPWARTEQERREWMYTAVTRAEKKLYVVKK